MSSVTSRDQPSAVLKAPALDGERRQPFAIAGANIPLAGTVLPGALKICARPRANQYRPTLAEVDGGIDCCVLILVGAAASLRASRPCRLSGRHDPNRLLILTVEQVLYHPRAISIRFVGIAPDPAENAEMIQHEVNIAIGILGHDRRRTGHHPTPAQKSSASCEFKGIISRTRHGIRRNQCR
jgi:hypothetical protein